MLAVIATGDGSVTSCQPEAVSLLDEPVARSVPDPLQRLTTWVLPSRLAL